MCTISSMQSLNDYQKLKMVKKTFGDDKDLNYAPYCMCCSSGSKMIIKSYGYKCYSCGNIIGFNGERLKESPLNDSKTLELLKIKKIVYSDVKIKIY